MEPRSFPVVGPEVVCACRRGAHLVLPVCFQASEEPERRGDETRCAAPVSLGVVRHHRDTVAGSYRSRLPSEGESGVRRPRRSATQPSKTDLDRSHPDVRAPRVQLELCLELLRRSLGSAGTRLLQDKKYQTLFKQTTKQMGVTGQRRREVGQDPRDRYIFFDRADR